MINCAMNFFGHLSCLVKEIRKIPAGNQECSKMRYSIMVTREALIPGPWAFLTLDPWDTDLDTGV